MTDSTPRDRRTIAQADDLARLSEELRASQLRFRKLADTLDAREAELALVARTTPVILARCSRDLRYLYLNPAGAQVLGGTPEELIGRPITEVMGAEAFEVIRPHVERVLAGEIVEYEQRVPYRSATRWIRATYMPDRDAQGEVTGWISSIIDVTEVRHAERATKFLADAGAALAGMTDEEATLRRIAELAVPEFADWCGVDMFGPNVSPRRVAAVHGDRAAPPETVSEEFVARTVRDAAPRAVRWALGGGSAMCVPLVSRGQAIGALSFVTADTGLAYREADLRAAEDLAQRAVMAIENARLYRALLETDRRKDEFIALLAHELRNPLAPVRNAAHYLKLRDLHEPDLVRPIDMIDRQVRVLSRLIDDLLDVSRLSRGTLSLKRERVLLADVIEAALDACRHEVDACRIDLRVTMPPHPVALDADRTRLLQVLVNLVLNAVKYSPAGGHIDFTAQAGEASLTIAVRDEGIGIPRDKLAEIFDLFAQVGRSLEHQGGLGVGLTLARQIVELHGGTIEARSEGAGQGSEFVIELPILIPALAPAGDVTGEPAGPSRRVLVVDDNPDSVESLALILEIAHHRVQRAYDGLAALESAAQNAPDVILLDIGMPKMNGYEVARRIRAEAWGERMHLVALTGWGQDDDKRRSREAGFDAHLVKPVDPRQLVRLLAELPARRPAVPAVQSTA